MAKNPRNKNGDEPKNGDPKGKQYGGGDTRDTGPFGPRMTTEHREAIGEGQRRRHAARRAAREREQRGDGGSSGN